MLPLSKFQFESYLEINAEINWKNVWVNTIWCVKYSPTWILFRYKNKEKILLWILHLLSIAPFRSTNVKCLFHENHHLNHYLLFIFFRFKIYIYVNFETCASVATSIQNYNLKFVIHLLINFNISANFTNMPVSSK